MALKTAYKVLIGLGFLNASGLTYGESQLETIVITGTRSEHESWDSPIAVQSIPVDPIRNGGKSTVKDLLSSTPGLELITGIRGASIRLDGLDAKYTLILLDGQRLNGLIGESVDLDRLSLASIERIEIVRGAASALYGSDAMGGVINIITKKGAKSGGSVRLGGNSLSEKNARATWQQSSGSFGWGVDTHALDARPLQLNGGEATTFSGRQERGIALRPVYRGENWDVASILSYDTEVISGTDVSGAGAIFSRENKIDITRLRLAPSRRFGDGSRLNLEAQTNIYHDDYEQYLRRTGGERKQESTNETTHDAGVSYQHLLDDHLLTWGLQRVDESLASDRLNSDEVTRQRSSLYAQDEWSIDDDLQIVPGFRFDQDTQFDEHVSSKLALRQAVGKDTVLRASYGEGYRAPAFKELYLLFENTGVGYRVQGNPDLDPETSRSARLGAEHRVTDVTTLAVDLFHNHLKDMIVASTLPPDSSGTQLFSYENIGRAETSGGELSVKSQFLSHLEAELRYGYLQARNLSTQTELFGRSKHSVSYRLALAIPDSDLHLSHSLKWQSPRLNPSGSDSTRGHALLSGDAALEYQPLENWLFTLNVLNLPANSGDAQWRIPPRSYGFAVNWFKNS